MSVDYYQIWCDGSYRQAHHRLGSAWICVAPDGTETERTIKHPVLQDTHAHGSDLAEIYAFTDAIAPLPDGADVVVHMDCRNVIEWLTSEKLSNKAKASEPRIRLAFEAAVSAKRRMKHVEIVYTSDKNSPNMGRVHTLSRAASTPGKKDNSRALHAD